MSAQEVRLQNIFERITNNLKLPIRKNGLKVEIAIFAEENQN